MKLIVAFTALMILSSCANPLNRVTYERYWKQGADAESAGRLVDAEQAFYRALMNVDMGNLGPLLKSQALYNLGRTKRMVGKYAEAEDLLKQSLVLHERVLSADDLNIDRCRIELSVALAAQGKWIEGSHYLEQVLPHAARFSGHERDYIAEAFTQFSAELRKSGHADRAQLFQQPTTGAP